MEEHAFERAGTRLYYRRWPGDAGRTLVMLHGLASNGTRWREFADRASGLRDWQILCPDLRGHGLSVCRGRLDSRQWMDDLLALLDRVGCTRAVLGGHCLGANLALRFALHHPGRVRGLVLVEPMLPAALHGSLRGLRAARWLLPALAWPVRVLNAVGIRRRRLPLLDLSALDRETRARMAEHGNPEAMLKRYARPGSDLRYMPVASYLQALYEVLREVGPIASVHAPTLALLSGGALLADPDKSRELLGAMPDLHIEQIDALHWIPTEQPEALTQAIVRFLDRLSVGSDHAP
jgi:pimeloyl-ACP methyl ester carboxylesterase